MLRFLWWLFSHRSEIRLLRLELKAGDAVVFTSTRHLSCSEAAALKEHWESLMPGTKAIVLPPELKMHAVLRHVAGNLYIERAARPPSPTDHTIVPL